MSTINAIGNSINLDAAISTDLTTSGARILKAANENQAAGDACYLNSSGKMQIVDADAIATSRCLYMCADATISADATGNYLLPNGFIRQNAWNWSAVGVPIFITVTGTSTNTLSETAPTGEDDCTLIVGIAFSADTIHFIPNTAVAEITA